MEASRLSSSNELEVTNVLHLLSYDKVECTLNVPANSNVHCSDTVLESNMIRLTSTRASDHARGDCQHHVNERKCFSPQNLTMHGTSVYLLSLARV
jgi:hypothetical protein